MVVLPIPRLQILGWKEQSMDYTKDMGKLEKRYVSETIRNLTDEGLADSSAKLLPENSVIISSRAPIGHLAINTRKMATNQGCKGLVPNKGLDSVFLYYFLENSVDYLNSLGTGTTFKELSGGGRSGGACSIPPPNKSALFQFWTKHSLPLPLPKRTLREISITPVSFLKVSLNMLLRKTAKTGTKIRSMNS